MNEKYEWKEYTSKVKPGFFKSLVRKTCQLAARFAFFNGVRIVFYRMMGVKVGSKVYIGYDCFIDSDFSELITIEDNAIVSFRVIIAAHDRKKEYMSPVLLKKESFIGAGAIVLPGVTVGEAATVGAGAVVVEDVPDGATAVGNPARILNQTASGPNS